MPRPKHIGPYKQYLKDPNILVPRTTAWKRQRENANTKEQIVICDEEDNYDTDSNISECGSSAADAKSCSYEITSTDEDSEFISRAHLQTDANPKSRNSLKAKMQSDIRKLKRELALYKGMASIANDFPQLVSQVKTLISFFGETTGRSCPPNFMERSCAPPLCHTQVESAMIQFGTKFIPHSIISQLHHEKVSRLVTELCTLVFSPQEMALCSMKGRKNNKYKGSFQKRCLDESKVQGIINYVLQKKGLSRDQAEKKIRKAIGYKLANFCRTDEGRHIIMKQALCQ